MIFNRRGSIKFFRPGGKFYRIRRQSVSRLCISQAKYHFAVVKCSNVQISPRLRGNLTRFRVTSVTRENLFSSFLSPTHAHTFLCLDLKLWWMYLHEYSPIFQSNFQYFQYIFLSQNSTSWTYLLLFSKIQFRLFTIIFELCRNDQSKVLRSGIIEKSKHVPIKVD